jgi:hypothetical protein
MQAQRGGGGIAQSIGIQHSREVGGQLHASAAVLPEKNRYFL